MVDHLIEYFVIMLWKFYNFQQLFLMYNLNSKSKMNSIYICGVLMGRYCIVELFKLTLMS